jgi:hypothetical protein
MTFPHLQEVDAVRSIEEVHESIKAIVAELKSKPAPALESLKLSDFNVN